MRLDRSVALMHEAGKAWTAGRAVVAMVLIHLSLGDAVAAHKAFHKWGGYCDSDQVSSVFNGTNVLLANVEISDFHTKSRLLVCEIPSPAMGADSRNLGNTFLEVRCTQFVTLFLPHLDLRLLAAGPWIH